MAPKHMKPAIKVSMVKPARVDFWLIGEGPVLLPPALSPLIRIIYPYGRFRGSWTPSLSLRFNLSAYDIAQRVVPMKISIGPSVPVPDR